MTQTLDTSVDHPLGGLYVQAPDRQQIAFPLKHTEVTAKIAGNLARVEVIQTFENPFTTTLEAVYVFPLSDESAVDDMLIRINDRTIQGSIKKRQEAKQIYEQAKQQGRTAGLLEQERDNIFTQSLANIQPGEQIDVIIRYTESLKFDGGDYEFVFPMVVAPRYIPGTTIEENSAGKGSAPAPMLLNQDTDLVPDASRLNAPILPPQTRSSHDINLTVEIDAGVEVRMVRSPSHQIQMEYEGQRVRVSLAGGDTIPNKDLILRYQVAGDRTQTTVLTQAGELGGHFALYLIPAIQYRPEQVIPKDVVFLIDTSGSQSGAPLFQCQELMRRFIKGLNPDDTFSIIDFSDTTQQLSPVPLSNTAQNRSRAIQYIDRLTAGGGTEMLRGIRAVLNFPITDPSRLRSIVLLTDGYIGNETQILAEVQRHLQPGNRLHSFGAGSSVNRFLLNRIAEIGRGTARIIRHDEPTDAVVDRFFHQINNPVLANIRWQWEGTGESPVMYPAIVPDLFAEQPLVLFGRKSDACAGKLHITGTTGGGAYQQTFDVNFQETRNPAIAQLWGRSCIKELMNQMVSGDTKAGVEAVTNTALTYQLLSQYTAFVAVSDDVRVNSTEGSVSVQVPVEIPEGIRYEGLFGNLLASPAPMTRSAVDQEMILQSIAPSAPLPGSMADPASEPEMWTSRINMDMHSGSGRLEEAVEFSEFNLSDLAPPKFEEVLDMPPPAAKRMRQESEAAVSQRLQIVEATGLDQTTIALLLQHLQQIPLPDDCGGDLVFEFQVNRGRVNQVVWDEQASSVQEQSVIDAIRRSLLTWKVSDKASKSVRLVLRIQAFNLPG